MNSASSDCRCWYSDLLLNLKYVKKSFEPLDIAINIVLSQIVNLLLRQFGIDILPEHSLDSPLDQIQLLPGEVAELFIGLYK